MSAPATAPRLLSVRELGAVVGRHAGLTSGQVSDFSTLAFNELRSALWSASGGTSPTYVARVLHAASLQLPPALIESLIPGGEERSSAELLREVLDHLETIGDASELPRGYWLPTPLRVVPLPSSKGWLLVGGIPTALLPEPFRRALRHTGMGRFLDHAPHSLGHTLPEQPMEDWIGRSNLPLETWTLQALDQAQLLPVGETVDGWELYHPDAGGKLQHFRWRPLTPSFRGGRYLARSPIGWGTSRYRVVLLREGKIVESGAPTLGRGDLRRLLYGLDAIARQSIPISFRRSGQEAIIEIRNALPGPEQRIMQALGRVEMPNDGKFYPQRWRMPVVHLSDIEYALAALRVELRTMA